MSSAHSISTRRAYGVQRICRVWERARSSVYPRRHATKSRARRCRRGPVGAAPDAGLARISLVPSTRSWYSCGEEGTDGCVLPGFTDAGTQGQRRRHGVEAGGGEVCGESGVGRPPEAAAARDG